MNEYSFDLKTHKFHFFKLSEKFAEKQKYKIFSC